MTNMTKDDAAPTQLKKSIIFLLLATAVSGIVAYWFVQRAAAPPLALSKVSIAVPTQPNSALVLLASAQGLFKKSGVEVASQPFIIGKEALQSVIDGHSDLAIVADVPYVLAVLGGNDIDILASISQARRSVAMVTRNDRGIKNLQDLRGKKVALLLGTNNAYFYDALLQVNKIPLNSVEVVGLNTPGIVKAFKDGSVDAAVIFQPFLAQIEQEMGDKIKIFYAEDLYSWRFLLVGKPGYIDAHPNEIRGILKGLTLADQAIDNDKQTARKLIGELVKVEASLMEKLFDPEDYVLSLDQALLLALDEQTRWALQRGLAKPGPVPNYLQRMKYKNLEAVAPAAVKIVR